LALLVAASAYASDPIGEAAIVLLVNECRAQNDLPPLREHSCLKQSSRMKVDDMAGGGYFSHRNSQGEGFWVFVRRAHYQYRSAAEILARGGGNERQMVDAWMDSPDHRRAILDPELKDISCSTRLSGTTYYVACHLGRPADKPMLPPTFRTAANVTR
jgi:uncharacterized protein YkwD